MSTPLGTQISRMLADRGVDVIFGIPGVHNVELYRGIEQAGIAHVLARHEQGAGFMADGYARAAGPAHFMHHRRLRVSLHKCRDLAWPSNSNCHCRSYFGIMASSKRSNNR